MDVPMELIRVLITELGDRQMIFLREKNGDRTFPIVIGIAEAIAIDNRLNRRTTPRPMTHDLLASVIKTMGGTIEKIVVNDLRDSTFIATLYVRQGSQLLAIDSRPPDAIALGSAFDTPIYVAEHVLEAVTAQPATKEDRLDLLRRRLDVLREKIEQVDGLLANEEFVADAPEAAIEEHRRHLADLRREYDAIEQVLKKYG